MNRPLAYLEPTVAAQNGHVILYAYKMPSIFEACMQHFGATRAQLELHALPAHDAPWWLDE